MSEDEKKKDIPGAEQEENQEPVSTSSDEQSQAESQTQTVNDAGQDMQYEQSPVDDHFEDDAQEQPEQVSEAEVIETVASEKAPAKSANTILPWSVAGLLAIALIAIIVITKPFEQPTVVANVNGHDIVEQDLYETMLSQLGNQNVDVIVNQLVAEDLVNQEAQKQKLTVEDKDYDERINRIKEQVGGEELFNNALANAGISLDDLKKNMKMDIYLAKIVSDKVKVTDEMVQTEFNAQKQQFTEPEQIRASHILVDDEQLANDLLKQLQDGADFAELAMANSKDGSAQQGGDLGYFPRGQMILQFENAAFGLKKDEISDVVETQFGFHIIKATDVPKDWTLEEKKDDIYDTLYQQQVSTEGMKWLEDQKASAEIEIFIGSGK